MSEERNEAFQSDHDVMMWNFYRLALQFTLRKLGNPEILLVPKRKKKEEQACV